MNKRIIYINNKNKVSVVTPSPKSGLSIEEIAQKDIPDGTQYTIVDADAIPQDTIFRDAWEQDSTTGSIVININTAKTITHTIRRKSRAKEFEPYDKIIALQIPGNDSIQAETKRAEIRLKYDTIQQNIDAAATVDDLTLIISQLNV